MCNHEVVNNWAQGNEGFTRSLRTNGIDLYSYNLKIGTTSDDGKKVLFDYTRSGGSFHSQTTSTHVNIAREHSDVTFRGDGMAAKVSKT